MGLRHKLVLKKLIQVGVIVKDLQSSMQKYIDYGVGPWYVLKFSSQNVRNMYVYGESIDYSMNIGVCPIGDVRFEIIEPIGESIYLDFYGKFGQGVIHHLKLDVDDFYEALHFLESRGIKVLQSGHQLGRKGKNIYDYLSIEKSLGFILEIVKVTSDFMKPDPDYWFYGKEQLLITDERVARPVFKGPSQVGIVVKDLKEKIEEYSEVYGARPWHVENFSFRNVCDMYVHGKRKKYSMKVAFCRVWNIQFKLIEPMDESIYTEFYEKYGEDVIHHLKMEVDDYQNTLYFLRSKGIEMLQSGNCLGKMRYSYFSTDKDINFITEISECSRPDCYCP
jgi:hypothetical protein